MKRSVNLFLCAALASTSFAVEKRKIDFVVGVDGDFKAAILIVVLIVVDMAIYYPFFKAHEHSLEEE